MQLRVLMVVYGLQVSSGVSSFVMNYFRAIDHERIQMDFALYDDAPSPYYAELEAAGARVWRLPSLKRPAKHLRACKAVFSEGKYDIVHNNTLLITWPLMYTAARLEIPVRMLHSHNSVLGETPLKEWRNRTFLPLLRGTATDYAACSGLAAKAMFGDADYSFIPNVISSERFSFSPVERQRIRSGMELGGRIVVGTVARPCPQKNPLFAVEIMERLIQREPRVEYWWIGSGNMDDALKKRVEQSGFKEHFRLLGSRDDVTDLYQAMDVFFLPSRFEGLPVTGLEAQAMGLPCVVSDAVTKEFVYSDLVRFVGLSEPAEHWTDALLRQIKRIPERRSYRKELESSAFSQRDAGEALWKHYRCALDKT